MKVGDLVQHFLTDQMGIILTVLNGGSACKVMWTTRGESLFGPGSVEWCKEDQLTVLSESR